MIKWTLCFVTWLFCANLTFAINHSDNTKTPMKACSKIGIDCSERKIIKSEASLTFEDEIWDQCCSREFIQKNMPEGMIVVFGGSKLKENHEAYILIRQFAKKWSLLPQSRKWPVVSGAGMGLMEAANRGAHDANAPTLGLGTYFYYEKNDDPSKRNVNSYLGLNKGFMYRSFTSREGYLVGYARAIIVGLGGIGTEMEIYESIAEIETAKKEDTPFILLGPNSYWVTFINRMYFFAKMGTTSIDICKYINMTDSVDKAIQLIGMKLNDRKQDASSLCQTQLWKKLDPTPMKGVLKLN